MKINMLALVDYSDEEIENALAECRRVIADKPPNTLASTGFWKAVADRQKLTRELVVRGASPKVPLPGDRLPMVTIAVSPDDQS